MQRNQKQSNIKTIKTSYKAKLAAWQVLVYVLYVIYTTKDNIIVKHLFRRAKCLNLFPRSRTVFSLNPQWKSLDQKPELISWSVVTCPILAEPVISVLIKVQFCHWGDTKVDPGCQMCRYSWEKLTKKWAEEWWPLSREQSKLKVMFQINEHHGNCAMHSSEDWSFFKNWWLHEWVLFITPWKYSASFYVVRADCTLETSFEGDNEMNHNHPVSQKTIDLWLLNINQSYNILILYCSLMCCELWTCSTSYQELIWHKLSTVKKEN